MSRGRRLIKVVDVEECTLETAVEEFYRHITAKGLAESTIKSHRVYLVFFVKWYGANKTLNSIRTKDLDAFLYYKKTERKNSDEACKTHMNHLRTFFNFCVERNYMMEIYIPIPKVEKKEKEPYSKEEMKVLLTRPQTTNWVEWRNWAMVNYFYGTGQRVSTVVNIKRKDVDLESAKVKLNWNKDKIQKWMPLSSAVVKVLEEYIMISGLEQEDYLFPEYEGKQLKVRSAQDSIADYNRQRGVEKTSIHLFRHTFARDYILSGGNPVKLQKLLNHKTMDMTLHYVHLYNTDLAEDLDLFNPLDNFKRTNYAPTKRTVVNL